MIEEISERIRALSAGKPRLLAAIDGRCAAGKTTLAAQLHKAWGCTVIHMDDFFLQPFQRTPARLSQPGGNVDRERFRQEVLAPLYDGKPFSYRPYACHTESMGAPKFVIPGPLTVIEGAYSCHPDLIQAYDLTLFLTVDPEEQARRILRRNGPEAAALFREKWIPLEEAYLSAFNIESKCDLTFRT